MDPVDDPNLPKIPFSKEDFVALTQCNGFLVKYGRSVRAVFLNLAVLIAIGLIGLLICLNIEFDPRTWPWWIYPLALILVPLALMHAAALKAAELQPSTNHAVAS
jgi:hypothetical protein